MQTHIMKYKYSTYEEKETDLETGATTTFMVCIVCGKRQHSNFGFECEYDMPGISAGGIHGYCNACSRKIIPILDQCMRKIHQVEEQIRRGEYE